MRAFIVRGDDEAAYQLASAEGGLVLTTGAESQLTEWAAKRNVEVVEANAGVTKPNRSLRGFVTVGTMVIIAGIALALMFHEMPTGGREPLLQLIGTLSGILGAIATFYYMVGGK